MAKIGLVDLCTSHPESWLPSIRKLGHEVVACWDSGDARPQGFAREFAAKHNIAFAAEKPEEMLGKIDIAIVHSADWDRHVERARPFVEAGVAVFLDKPVAGNLRDLNTVLDWCQRGFRVTGGSSLRYAKETRDFLARPATERGTPHTLLCGCGVDDINYGIHAYSLAAGVFGGGIRSVKYWGVGAQKLVEISWSGERKAVLAIGRTAQWIPFHATIVTERAVHQFIADNNILYFSMLEKVLPYLARETDTPPVPSSELLEPELAALAARLSWQNRGAEVFLSDLRLDDPGYDGHQFVREYARARLK